ncbi:MAG: DUF3458 domain-containing protein, partial [Myxococcota bacterium]
DDFREAMGSANGVDFTELERWYQQAGTPVVRGRGAWDAEEKEYRLTLSQSQREFPEQDPPKPLPIPIRVGLLAQDGSEILGSERTLVLRDSEEEFVFKSVNEAPVLSAARGFSAPIKLDIERTPEELAFLLAHDTDSFSRWEAGQDLAQRVLLELTGRGDDTTWPSLDSRLVDAFRDVLRDPELDGSIKSLTLTLPSEERLAQAIEEVDPTAVHRAREFATSSLADALRTDWEDTYERHAEGPDLIEKSEIDRRRLKNRALRYLVALGRPELIVLAKQQFDESTTMTEYEGAFVALVDTDTPEADAAIEAFHERWKGEPLVLDKWFRMQAMSTASRAFDRVVSLASHPDFTLSNPNRARSLLYAFAMGNPVNFHRADGAGYRFVVDQVLELDGINPQVASRVVSSFNQWKRYEPKRQALMHGELERIAAHPGLSKDVAEIVGQALR